MELKHLKHLETLTGKVPLKELQFLIENREEVTDELLQIIDYTVENGEKLAEDGSFILHIIAMHTLAYFREHFTGDHRSKNIVRILEKGEMYQEDNLVSKEDVLDLSRWLGAY